MSLEDDPSYFYVGRIGVNQWKSDKNYSTVVLDYDLSPFKYAWTKEHSVPWEVSSQTDGEGWTKMEVTVTGSAAISLEPAGDMPVVPVFWVETLSGTLKMTVAEGTYTLAKGKNRIPECAMKEKALPVVFEGNATLHIYLRRGWL